MINELDKKYDAIILGGGLAGTTLALQLKQAKLDMSILVLEKRPGNAPIAGHKVGESISELGSYYLRETLQLKAYLTEHQLRKFGFRFFFSQNSKDNIAKRVEFGSKITDPIPAHQIDRGLFENELIKRLIDKGIDVVLGAKVKSVDLSKEGHSVHYEKDGIEMKKDGSWIIDSTGRRGFLKRKLGLEKKNEHNINAAWFRLEGEIDIDDWSDDEVWKNKVGPGKRRLATNHLMGKGYWIWIIALVSGNTSIGIVADPRYHTFDQINTFDKAINWLENNEPLAAKVLKKHNEREIDFKVMKQLAHDTKQFYSTDRWGLTGDAGVFMDPFYSPGIDFIALNNSWLTELIVRDSNHEDISLRCMIYEHAQRELINGWILLYKNMYPLFGNTQIMLMKIVWDWGSYWGIPTLIFRNNGYTNIALLKKYSARKNNIGQRFSKINERMQKLFLGWNNFKHESYSNLHLNVFDLKCLYQFHRELDKKYTPEDLIKKIESNLEILEQIAAEIFRLASYQVHGTSLDMPVNPFNMNIDDKREVLIEKSKETNTFSVVQSIKTDLATIWLDQKEVTKNEYV